MKASKIQDILNENVLEQKGLSKIGASKYMEEFELNFQQLFIESKINRPKTRLRA